MRTKNKNKILAPKNHTLRMGVRVYVTTDKSTQIYGLKKTSDQPQLPNYTWFRCNPRMAYRMHTHIQIIIKEILRINIIKKKNLHCFPIRSDWKKRPRLLLYFAYAHRTPSHTAIIYVRTLILSVAYLRYKPLSSPVDPMPHIRV